MSSEDRRRLEEKIAEVERRTAGEIVVHVVPRSDGYAAVRIGYAVFVAYLAVLAGTYGLPADDAAWAVLAFFPVLGLAWWILGRGALLRYLIPTTLREAGVHRRAELSFLEHGVHKTRDGSGVLILLSELERRVEIIADEGVHRRVSVDGWRRHVDEIVGAIRAGRAAEGLIQVIARIGEELAVDFPPRAENPDELGNEVRVTES